MQRRATYAGYLAKDSPDKLVNKPWPCSTSPTFVSSEAIPDKKCPACGETCTILTSHTMRNPERKFYRCPNHQEKEFFQWCDEATPNRRHNILPSPKSKRMSTAKKRDTPQLSYPECACGAGPCNLATAVAEENKGRKYFLCPVKKGQGACNFVQWQDSPENAVTGNHTDAERTNRPTWTPDNQERRQLTFEDAINGVNLNVSDGIISCGSADTTPEKLSSREDNFWEQTVEADSEMDDLLLQLMEDLELSDKKTSIDEGLS